MRQGRADVLNKRAYRCVRACVRAYRAGTGTTRKLSIVLTIDLHNDVSQINRYFLFFKVYQENKQKTSCVLMRLYTGL